MKIATFDGAMTLPGSFILNSTSKMEAFRRSDLYDAKNTYNPGTPWFYHRFQGGDGDCENYPLCFVACFYQSPKSRGNVLTNCSFGASRIASEQQAAWTLEESVCDLELNLRLLESLLGKPHDHQKNSSSWDGFPVFQRDWFYQFKWGQVWCGNEDIKTNLIDTSINVRYIANAEWARGDYERHRPPHPAIN